MLPDEIRNRQPVLPRRTRSTPEYTLVLDLVSVVVGKRVQCVNTNVSFSVCMELGGMLFCVCMHRNGSNVISRASSLCMHRIGSNVFGMDCQ